MARKVDLTSYLPQFVLDYREFKQIMERETPEFQTLADEMADIKNNQFILTCDEAGIQNFERILKIPASDDATLESRKSRVMIRWLDVVPYTYRALLQKLSTLCDGDFELFPEFGQYKMRIVTHLDLYGQVDELQTLMSQVIPANIVITSFNELKYTLRGGAFVGAGMVLCQIVDLSDSFNSEIRVEGSAGFGATLIGTVEVTLT